MTKKLILVSNDDGYNSDGIRALAEAVSDYANVVVVAPATDQSAVSHAMTLFRPLRLKEHKNISQNSNISFYSVDGTPTDAIYLAVHHLLKGQKIDLICSGINHGPNLGQDVFYSGTVSAAMEGAFLGIPAVAYSLVATHGFNFSAAQDFINYFTPKVLNNKIPKRSLLNVNFPKRITQDSLKNYTTTEIGLHHYGTEVEERTDPRGKKYYWIGGDWSHFDNIPNSDCVAISEGKISVTPVQANLTNKNMLDWLKKL